MITKLLRSGFTKPLSIILASFTFLSVYAFVFHQLGRLSVEQNIIIYQVDNAYNIVGKVTDKEIIDGKHTVTVGAYGKFLVTEEQYNTIKVGDGIPNYLQGVSND